MQACAHAQLRSINEEIKAMVPEYVAPVEVPGEQPAAANANAAMAPAPAAPAAPAPAGAPVAPPLPGAPPAPAGPIAPPPPPVAEQPRVRSFSFVSLLVG